MGTFHFAVPEVAIQVTLFLCTLLMFKWVLSLLLPLPGVVTFSRNCATPFAAEEGLTGVLGEGSGDAVGCHDQWDDFSREEVSSTVPS